MSSIFGVCRPWSVDLPFHPTSEVVVPDTYLPTVGLLVPIILRESSVGESHGSLVQFGRLGDLK